MGHRLGGTQFLIKLQIHILHDGDLTVLLTKWPQCSPTQCDLFPFHFNFWKYGLPCEVMGVLPTILLRNSKTFGASALSWAYWSDITTMLGLNKDPGMLWSDDIILLHGTNTTWALNLGSPSIHMFERCLSAQFSTSANGRYISCSKVDDDNLLWDVVTKVKESWWYWNTH